MMKPLALALSIFGLAAVQSLIAVPSADAKIVCRDGFQNSNGNWISTPYCNDADLAQIARKHGVRVSDAEVRNNPAKKYELCRFLGPERTRDYCPDDSGSGRR
ncbi:hypothetical protein [uncultured Hyphomicrobium sp.]|uniref:hypothetical protein n=1 Tax=uncultured Hyphomicrobium sp. TaxID=194373 RepID=UPI0025F0855D|nr:hypothetical protein [uncultured Hyphomicrobium sp.]